MMTVREAGWPTENDLGSDAGSKLISLDLNLSTRRKTISLAFYRHSQAKCSHADKFLQTCTAVTRISPSASTTVCDHPETTDPNLEMTKSQAGQAGPSDVCRHANLS